MNVYFFPLLLLSTCVLALEPVSVNMSPVQNHAISPAKPVQLSQQENKITLRCANQMLTFEQDGMGDIKSTVQRYDYPHFSLLTLPVSSGYGGVNIFYRLVRLVGSDCSLATDNEIANPELMSDKIESSMKSGPRYIDRTYQLNADGEMTLVSERENYANFCIETLHPAEIAAIDCNSKTPDIYLTVGVPRASFYASAESENPRKSYLIKGDRVHLLDFSFPYARYKVAFHGKRVTTGWIAAADIDLPQ
ncbi:hypothetical protein [Aeromonas media]|uniref:hypothetical protein n=1 Tax=Aeromonas media TaxID=651 RepID=UPI0022402635|nr:hypothetical protein [Aeromonas media]